jgi:hypothetical protein
MASSDDITTAELTTKNNELSQKLEEAVKVLTAAIKKHKELKENNHKLKKQLDGTTHH